MVSHQKRQYPVETITDTDYADDLALLIMLKPCCIA